MPPKKLKVPAHTTPTLPDDGFMRLPDVLKHIPVSERTWWRGIALGRYPKPIKLSPNIDGWRVRTIRQLCAEFAAQDDPDDGPF